MYYFDFGKLNNLFKHDLFVRNLWSQRCCKGVPTCCSRCIHLLYTGQTDVVRYHHNSLYMNHTKICVIKKSHQLISMASCKAIRVATVKCLSLPPGISWQIPLHMHWNGSCQISVSVDIFLFFIMLTCPDGTISVITSQGQAESFQNWNVFRVLCSFYQKIGNQELWQLFYLLAICGYIRYMHCSCFLFSGGFCLYLIIFYGNNPFVSYICMIKRSGSVICNEHRVTGF